MRRSTLVLAAIAACLLAGGCALHYAPPRELDRSLSYGSAKGEIRAAVNAGYVAESVRAVSFETGSRTMLVTAAGRGGKAITVHDLAGLRERAEL